VAGVDWITRNAVHPAVANMSLRSTYSRTLNSSVAAAIRSGVTVVVAAGNDGADACNYSPGSVRDAITVGGIDAADTRLYYSNFGSCVSLFAPGEGVSTIWNTTTTTTTYASGTSFASPYVAGVAALYLADHPAATPAEVKSAIVGNATNNVVLTAGAGSPNLLLYSLFATTPPPTSGCSGTSFAGTLTEGMSAYQSSVDGFSTPNGTFVGSLTAPAGTAFALTLEKKVKMRWSEVATTSGTTNTQISYRGKSGIYRWRIDAVTGSGDYTLCSTTP
jgi:subtilisin family serine protease